MELTHEVAITMSLDPKKIDDDDDDDDHNYAVTS
jgi:hypothetical protein